jgi:hypothetical protein
MTTAKNWIACHQAIPVREKRDSTDGLRHRRRSARMPPPELETVFALFLFS